MGVECGACYGASGNIGRLDWFVAVHVDSVARMRVRDIVVRTERIKKIKITLHDNIIQVSDKLVVQLVRDFFCI